MQEYKGYNLGRPTKSPMFIIKAKGQGRVPKPLTGLFTSYGKAVAAVDGYLNSLKKGTRHGRKTEDSPSG